MFVETKPVRTVEDEIKSHVRDAEQISRDFTTSVDAINAISDAGLISLRQQRLLLLMAADQAANELRDVYTAIDRSTADWEHQHGHKDYEKFEAVAD